MKSVAYLTMNSTEGITKLQNIEFLSIRESGQRHPCAVDK